MCKLIKWYTVTQGCYYATTSKYQGHLWVPSSASTLFLFKIYLPEWLKKDFNSALFKLWAVLKFDSGKNTTKFNGYTSNSISSVNFWVEIDTQSPGICPHFNSSQRLNKVFHILLSLWLKLWALQILQMFREPLNNQLYQL